MAEFQEDTIAAVATAMAPSGIGIVRISGQDAFAVADRIYRGKKEKKLKEQKANTIHYGWIEENGQTLDEVLVMLMKAPHSYTGEDTVEIDCHGGILAVRRVLEAVCRNGARPAEPGEFTKRAFLNGRIDMSQAEAVMDIISAKNEYALKSSLNQLKGSIRQVIEDIRKKLIYEIARIESALDDPEHMSLDGYGEELSPVVKEQKQKIDRLLEKSDQGKLMQEGIKTVISLKSSGRRGKGHCDGYCGNHPGCGGRNREYSGDHSADSGYGGNQGIVRSGGKDWYRESERARHGCRPDFVCGGQLGAAG